MLGTVRRGVSGVIRVVARRAEGELVEAPPRVAGEKRGSGHPPDARDSTTAQRDAQDALRWPPRHHDIGLPRWGGGGEKVGRHRG